MVVSLNLLPYDVRRSECFIYLYLFICLFMVICTPDPTGVTVASCTVHGFKRVNVVLSVYSRILHCYYAFTLELQSLLLSPKLSYFLVLSFHRSR